MRPVTFRSAALLALALIAGAASAQTPSITDWRGFYGGLNIGGAWNTTCNTWNLNNVSNPVIVNAFNNRDCPNNGVFVGGVQIGYNFQHEEWVWGFGLDYDIWSAKNRSRSYTYAGATPPPDGTYSFYGKVNPNGFAILGPRIGYSVDNWLPYLRLGGVFTGGSHSSTSSFTDASGTASFSGGKNFKSNGFGAGVGSDFKIDNAWFFRAEYTYVSLGKGSTTVTQCTGTAATCAEFGNFELNNLHNKFTASVFRVSINYRFGAEEPAPAPVPVAAPPPPPPRPPPPPPPPPPPKPVSLCPDTPKGAAVDKYGCPCDVSQEVHFATNSSVLTDQDKVLLDRMIATLKRLNFVDGEVDGYTDSTGSAAYNKGLSERRAQAVADYLTSNGVGEHRLAVKGFGADNPVADNKTAEGRAHNRRVVLHRTDCSK
ncbi:MAG TPA: OmpA family protein [Steroidobacteraceae bacterium]|nr:OmpA family protein [Steroidobacteraceae bacterium]